MFADDCLYIIHWRTLVNANLCRKLNINDYWQVPSFSLHLIRKSKRYGLWLRDVVIILRQLKFKKSQSTNTFHHEPKKVFEPMFVLESKRKDSHEVLGLLQRSFRLHDVITFWRNWPFISLGSGIIIFYCRQILLNQLHKRQKYRDMHERHQSVIAVWKFKTGVSKETLRVGV